MVGLGLSWLNDFWLFDGHVGKGGYGFPLGGVDHLHEFLRVLVDAECYLLVLVIVNSVEMTKEKLPENKVLVVKFVQLVLGNGELALALGLEKVLGWIYLKNGLTACRGLSAADEETNWLQFLFYVSAPLLLGLAEVSVARAVKVWDGLLPLSLQPFEER